MNLTPLAIPAGGRDPLLSPVLAPAGGQFCRDAFWDVDLTWNTDNPDLTICFQQTALVYVPCGLLFLSAPLSFYLASGSKERDVPWTPMNMTKLGLNILIFLLPILSLGELVSREGKVFTAEIIAPLVKMCAFALTALLQLTYMKRGFVTSGLSFIFWLLMACVGAVTFRSVLMRAGAADAWTELPVLSYLLQYPIVLAMLFLNCWADPMPRYRTIDENVVNLTPEVSASFLSKVVFAWFDPFAWKGWKTLLNYDDMFGMPFSERCAGIVQEWYKNADRIESKKQRLGRPHKCSILSIMIPTFGPEYALSGLCMLVSNLFTLVNPVIVDWLITFVSSDDPTWKGLFYTALICASSAMVTLSINHAYYLQYNVGMKIRTALTAAVYRKTVKLSNSGRKEMTVGETTNLMSIDSQKIMDLTLYLNYIWSTPLLILLGMIFLWKQLGPASLAGLAVMVIMIPINLVVGKLIRTYQYNQMKFKDKRTHVMDEILNGIKILKLYAWESSFEKQVLIIRDKEISALKKASYLNSIIAFFFGCAPFLIALACFTTFLLSDSNNILDPNTAFVSITIFNILRVPLNLMPMLIVFMIQAQVSFQRINKFLNADELNLDSVTHDTTYKEAVSMERASFGWDTEARACLKNISLKINEGEFVAVVGAVGTGKSSLLSSMLGEMELLSGHINTKGKIAYVPQQAWMQNASMRHNITFGKRMKDDLYQKVIESCALAPDLEMFPGGDQTEIGEKGLNLSGGQKQRVSMARAVYSNGDLYLLDDPLSAVDSHVGKHIFEKVIGPNGLLRKKTRILVTHGIGYLPKTDKIYVMKDGRISEEGTYQELLDHKGEFANFLVQYLTEREEEEEKEDPDSLDAAELKELKGTLEQTLGKEILEKERRKVKSANTILSDFFHSDKRLHSIDVTAKSCVKRSRNLSESTVVALAEPMNTGTIQLGQILTEEEKMAVGGVKWDVYKYFCKSAGYFKCFLACLFYFSYQAFQLGGNTWLTVWTSDPKAVTDIGTRNKYILVYLVIGIFQGISVMLGTVFVLVEALVASQKIHQTMLEKLMKCPMYFFDTNPVGRILNRFSKDVDIADTTLPINLRSVFVQTVNVLGTMTILCIVMPVYLIVIIPVLILYYLFQKFYMATARQVKRMESTTRSPIYSQFGETLTGAPTIRAYNMIDTFIEESDKKVDFNQMCYYPSFVSSRWLSLRVEAIGNIIILFTALFSVLFRDALDPANTGLVLSYALNVTGAMSMLVRMASEVETNMVSIERMQEYQEIPAEAPFEIPEQDPPPEWPQHGVVKFENYQTRYREGLDLVLRGIDCVIQSGEKIGIVGRTGAGKSSLTLALFRIIESAGGSIYIDGENIGLLGLSKLRSRLTIIPQDPVLFSGTMKMNLDPFSQYNEREIWKALERAHLKSYVSHLPEGLSFEVSEGGDNLSLGQRQLVCLARALLRKTKVLVLDEATAAVDFETDDLIQETIREAFSDCTVLTIAHRLNTILDSSKVMVLDSGKIKEFDSPESLLANNTSIFYGMCKDAGLVNVN